MCVCVSVCMCVFYFLHGKKFGEHAGCSALMLDDHPALAVHCVVLEVTVTAKQTYTATSAQNIAVSSLVGVINPNDQIGFVAEGTGCGSAAMEVMAVLPASDGNAVVDMTGRSGELDVCVCDATISATGTCTLATGGDWADPSGGAVIVSEGWF